MFGVSPWSRGLSLSRPTLSSHPLNRQFRVWIWPNGLCQSINPSFETNKTNPNWQNRCFRLLEAVNIPPPLSLSPVPSLVKVIVCLSVRLSCFACFSRLSQVYVNISLSASVCVFCKLAHITSLFDRKLSSLNTNFPVIAHLVFPLQENTQHLATQWMLARQTDRRSWASCVQPVIGIAFTLRVTTTCICHICTCSQCQICALAPCPQTTPLECYTKRVK